MSIQRMPRVPWFDKPGSGVTSCCCQASFLISTQGQSQELFFSLQIHELPTFVFVWNHPVIGGAATIVKLHLTPLTQQTSLQKNMRTLLSP